MSGVIDTNLLLYGVNSDYEEHRSAGDFLAASLATNDSWFFTEGIVYEFLRVSTHARVFPKPLSWTQSIKYLDKILCRDNVSILSATADHWPILTKLLKSIRRPAGNLFFDIRTYTLMKEHSIKKIYTADSDFLQFEGIEVINPIR